MMSLNPVVVAKNGDAVRLWCMAQRRHHYEQAFEAFVRQQRIPYVAVNEARKALLPNGVSFRFDEVDVDGCPVGPEHSRSLKSFDFVVYGDQRNLLVEVKGRRLPKRSASARAKRPGLCRLESWVNGDDVRSLMTWERLFGQGFEAVFVFLYWCEDLPADGLFEEIFEHHERWYALRVVNVSQYGQVCRVRSQRWGTVHVDGATFAAISTPFTSGFLGNTSRSGLKHGAGSYEMCGDAVPALEMLE